MARSLLRSFVSGTRQMLTAQLIVSVGVVALAGWTLGVTNDLIRERDRLKDRVIQLEQSMGTQGIVVPATPATVDQPTSTPNESYPPANVGAAPAPAPAGTDETPKGEDATNPATTPVAPPSVKPTTETPAPGPASNRAFDPGRVIGELFTPPPALRIVVLHVRGAADARAVQRIARAFGASAHVAVTVDMMQPGDPRASGYAYFDGRQSRPAAALVAQFNDISRRYEIAAWSAQLRGVALPAQGQYGAERLDIVLPAIPGVAAPPTRIETRPGRFQ